MFFGKLLTYYNTEINKPKATGGSRKSKVLSKNLSFKQKARKMNISSRKNRLNESSMFTRKNK